MDSRLAAAVAVVLCLSCARQPDRTPPQIIDLSHAFGIRTLYWPTSPSTFSLEQLAHGHIDAGYFYSAYRLATPEHGGTHLDAPVHFAEGKRTTDQIPHVRTASRSNCPRNDRPASYGMAPPLAGGQGVSG